MNQEGFEDPIPGDGEAEDGAQVNGTGEHAVNGHEHDQDMAGGEEQAQPQASSVPLQGDRQPNKVRVTTPYLTKYERARVLGTRALQIRSAFS